jgi:uncharacterized protein YjdB
MPADARDWYISPQGNSGYEVGGGWETPASLRYALDNLATGDTLRMSTGVYERSQAFVTDKSFSIVAVGANVIIQSSGADRLFVFNGGSAQSVLLRGIGLSGGDASLSAIKPNCGGAIYVTSLSVVTLQDVTLSDNKGSTGALEGSGGAIYNEGVLNLTGSTLFQANTASLNAIGTGSGGAVYNNGGTIRISGTTAFRENKASGKGENSFAYGGAIYHTGQGASLKIEGPSEGELSSGNVPSFEKNMAALRTGTNLRAEVGSAYGGAIYMADGTVLEINRAYFGDNVASYSSSDGYGGAIYVAANGYVSMEHVILSGNIAATEGSSGNGYGGAIWNAGGINIRHTQLIGNIASTGSMRGHGGGIYNTYISGNKSKNGKLYFGGEVVFKDNIALSNSSLRLVGEVIPVAFGGAIAIVNSSPAGGYSMIPEISITTDTDDDDRSFSLLFEGNIAGKTTLGDAGGGAIGIMGAIVIVGDDIYDQNIVFRNNVALANPESSEGGYGGAIMGIGTASLVVGETLVCYGADFKGNVATMSLTGVGRGGAIASTEGAKIHVIRGNVEENYANGNPESTGKAWGGAYAAFSIGGSGTSSVFIAAGESMLLGNNGADGVKFRNNAATKGKGQGFGGAASMTDGGILRFSDRTCIEGNEVKASDSGEGGLGGGIYISNEDNPSLQGRLQLREAIVRRNKAAVGGGIWLGNIDWLQYNEQQTLVTSNEAPIAPNIYPTDKVCLVEIRQITPEVNCIPEYNTYAVIKGLQFKFTLTGPKGQQVVAVKTNSNGQASQANLLSVRDTVWSYSVPVDADTVIIWCGSSLALRKPLSIITPSGLKSVVLAPGEKITLPYHPNLFLTIDPVSVQWRTTDLGVAEVAAVGVSNSGEITAKEPGFAYITAGITSGYSPSVYPPGAFTGNLYERDTVLVYVIDSDLEKELDSMLGRIHYPEDLPIAIQLPNKWGILANEEGGTVGNKVISWSISDTAVAKLDQFTSMSGTIRFKKAGHTQLILELKMKPGYQVVYDLYVIDPLKLQGFEKEVFNVAAEVTCILTETGLPQQYREVEWIISNPAIAHIEKAIDYVADLQMDAFGQTMLTVRLKADITKYVIVQFSVVRLMLNFPEVVLTNVWTTGTVQFVPSDVEYPVKWVKPKNVTGASEIHANGNKAAIQFQKQGQAIVAVEIVEDSRGMKPDVKDSVRVTVIDTSYIVFLSEDDVEIVPSAGTMQLPSNETLKLAVRPEIPDVYYTWSSDNEFVARFVPGTGTYQGLLKTVSRGAATISAICSRNPNLVVKQRIFVKEIAISDSVLFLPLRDTLPFNLPEDIDPGKVIWSTTDENIARINRGNIIVGDIPGKAVVSAKPLLNETDELPISSIQRTVYAVKLNLEVQDMPLGTSAYFQVSAQPSGVITRATDIVWTSSSSALTINEQGQAHAVAATAEPILVTASLKANPKVKVMKVVWMNPVQSITIQSPSYGDPSFEYQAGGKLYKFGVLFTPAGASDTVVTWENLTPEIFTIENQTDNSAEIKVLKAGTGKISAKTPNGCTDTYTFTTISSDIQIDLDKVLLSLRKGSTYTLSAHVKSETDPAVGIDPVFTFISEKPQVATVDAYTGLIEAKEYGETHVTVMFEYGLKMYKADCLVKVENALDSIGIKSGTFTVEDGDTLLVDKYGGDKQLQISFYPSDATNKDLRYRSSQPLVATISALGWVRPLSDGHTEVTVQEVGNGDTLKTFVVKVQTPLQNLRLNSHNLTLGKGRAYPLRVSFEPEDVSVRPSLQWTSGDLSIVSVDNAGWLELKGEGKTFVKVATADTRFSDTCWINVEILPESLTLDKAHINLNKGMSALLTPVLLPQGVTNKGLQWKTDNAGVASVQSENGDGRISAQGVGTATITVTTEDGILSASCVVTVESLVDGVYLSHSSLSMNKEESRLLRAEVTPLDAYRMGVAWSSDNEKVVEVTELGKITAKGSGTARITAKTEDGFEATCQVSVSVPVQSIHLDPPLLVVYQGQEFSFTASFVPEDASAKEVYWMVDNQSILDILSRDNSKVCYFLAKKSGWVIIQAESSDHKAICQISLFVMNGFGGGDELSPVLETAKPEVTYANGALRAVNLEGYRVSVTSIHGKTCGLFHITGIDEALPLNLPTGIYILTARKGEERFVWKFIGR